MGKKERIDILLMEKGLTVSRTMAQRLVMAGEVRVNGQSVAKPSQKVERNAEITVLKRPRFVSRGGEKLAAALDAFQLDVSTFVCADVGASTGGFSDCLLQAGAEKIYAIDVGHGILHWKLRQNPKIIVMERTNARLLAELPEKVQLVTIDASFISLKLLFPVVLEWMLPEGILVALIKPQFEAGRERVGHGGVVRDAEVHREVLETVLAAAAENALTPQGLIRSPLKGPKGNIEFLVWCDRSDEGPAMDSLIAPLFSD